MTAAEARERSQKINEEKYQKQLIQIRERIEKSVESGSICVECDREELGILEDAHCDIVFTILSKDGYSLFRNDKMFRVSW